MIRNNVRDTVMVFVALMVLGVLLRAYFQIQVWGHDDEPNLAVHFDWHPLDRPPRGPIGPVTYDYITGAGRWLSALLFPLLQHLSGKLAVYLDIACLLGFLLICARRCGAQPAYAISFAVLGLLSMPVTDQLAVWPVFVLPSTALLLAAAVTVKRLPTWLFYAIFGVLFVGSVFTYYFLLPLLHLPLLAHDGLRAGARALVLRVFCPWIGGFLLGQGVMLAIVYLYTLIELGSGQVGLNIEGWRQISPSVSDGGLIKNAAHVTGVLLEHLRIFTADRLDVAFVALAGLALVLSGPVRHIPYKALACVVVLSVYCTALTVGITISLRMGLAAAVGAAALFFLPPSPRRAVYAAQIALLIGLIALWGATSYHSIIWRVGVTEAYRMDLLRVTSPERPDAYEGVIIVGYRDTIRATTRRIERERRLPSCPWPCAVRLDMLGGGDGMRWRPVAATAGFRRAIPCEVEIWASDPVCQEALRLAAANEGAHDGANIYRVLGTAGGGRGWLVLRLNEGFGLLTPMNRRERQ